MAASVRIHFINFPMKRISLIISLLVLVSSSFAQENKRTIVTTDGEIDDVDTFLRFLLYTNEFDTEGLIYSSSMWHWKGDGKGPCGKRAIRTVLRR